MAQKVMKNKLISNPRHHSEDTIKDKDTKRTGKTSGTVKKIPALRNEQ